MKDRSDDTSHKRTLLPRSYINPSVSSELLVVFVSKKEEGGYVIG